jgi:hypothetical protein
MVPCDRPCKSWGAQITFFFVDRVYTVPLGRKFVPKNHRRFKSRVGCSGFACNQDDRGAATSAAQQRAGVEGARVEEGEDRAYSRAVATAGAAAASRRMPQLGTIAELEPDPDCSAIYDGMDEQISCTVLCEVVPSCISKYYVVHRAISRRRSKVSIIANQACRP